MTMKDDGQFITPLYLRCLISSMAAILGSVLGQIVSTMIIGRALGPQELSVIGVTLPIYYVYATAGAMLGVGGTAVCARLIGARQFDESRLAFTIVYILTILIAIFISGTILVFARPITGILGVSRDMVIYDKALEYTRILSIGGVFIMCIYPAFNLLRLDGRNLAVTAVFAVMAAVNILAGVLLLLVLKTGVSGAAVATVIGAGTAGVMGALLLFRGSRNFAFSLSGMKAAFGRLSAHIILSGSPSALENLCTLVRTIALNWILVKMLADMAALSAFKITDSVNSLAVIFIAGASGSLIPFAGVFCMEKDVKSVRQLLALAFKWGGLMTAAFTALCVIFPNHTAGLLGMGGGEAALAVRVFAISLPLSLVNNILVCLYQAGRRTAAANLLTLGRSLVMVILPAIILSSRFGAAGVWHSFWIAELLAFIFALLTSLYYRSRNKYLSRVFLLDTEAEARGAYESFSVKNTPEAITQSAAGISEFCEANNLSPGKTMAISLAIEEMLISIHQHCLSGDENQTISVRVLIFQDLIIMRIRNAGKPFNPIIYYEQMSREQNTENTMDALEQLSDSLGIKMILALAETVDYRATFGVNNITVIL